MYWILERQDKILSFEKSYLMFIDSFFKFVWKRKHINSIGLLQYFNKQTILENFIISFQLQTEISIILGM